MWRIQKQEERKDRKKLKAAGNRFRNIFVLDGNSQLVLSSAEFKISITPGDRWQNRANNMGN